LVQSPLVIFLVALAMRIWAASQLLPQKAGSFFYQNNEPARIAWALVTGHGFSSPWPNTPLLPTAQQPPGYPLLLAGIFRIFGPYTISAIWAALLLNIIFAALTAVVILEFGRRNFGTLVAVLASWVWACWLYETAVSIRLWENALSALLLSVSLLILPTVVESSRVSRWLLFGLLAGVAALVNTSLLILFPVFWAWLWFTSRVQAHARSRLVLSSFVVCLLLVLPWTIRNYAVFHRVIPVRDNFGLEFWLGNHEGAPNGLQKDFPLMDPTEYNRLGEIKFMEAKEQIGFQFARQHPGYFLKLCLMRIHLFWTDPQESPWWLITTLAWIGGFLALYKKKPAAIPFLAVLLIFPIVYYVTHSFPTYRFPIEPLMLILAAYTVVSLTQSIFGKLVGRTSGLAVARN
jgi:4-amino-4-deoxy-L-arabinose transferase-like glycosyltransferase